MLGSGERKKENKNLIPVVKEIMRLEVCACLDVLLLVEVTEASKFLPNF